MVNSRFRGYLLQQPAPEKVACFAGTGRLQFWDIRGRSGVLLEVSAISVKRLHLTKLFYDPEHQKLAAGSTSGRIVLWSLSHRSDDQTDASCIECNQVKSEFSYLRTKTSKICSNTVLILDLENTLSSGVQKKVVHELISADRSSTNREKKS